MESSPNRLLRDRLAELYPRESDVRTVLNDVGVNAGNVAFDAKATNTWTDALVRIREAGKLNELAELQPKVASLVAAVLQTNGPATAAPSPAPAPIRKTGNGRAESLEQVAVRARHLLPRPQGPQRAALYLLRFQPHTDIAPEHADSLLAMVRALNVVSAALLPSTDSSRISIVVWEDPSKIGRKHQRLRWIRDFYQPSLDRLPDGPSLTGSS